MYNFIGDNPTTLYKTALDALVEHGDEVRPRGKLVKELRPTAIEFTNPYNRTTFLGTRKINPFFQMAESLWIISGRSDVDWLTKFNANMATFSDDGVYFNAPYGERIMRWGENMAHGIVEYEPLNQLVDVYKRFIADKDTRQATIAIGNPSYDNYEYLHIEQGKDIACNLYITFKIRNDKLTMTVFNRSNDLHWGTFGANLCQFTTIQELLCSWLRNSGKDKFKNLELGTYCQFTDSLHIYMEDYGAKITDDVLDYYKDEAYVEHNFECKNEPRMNLSIEKFNEFLNNYWDIIDPFISNDEFVNADYNATKKAFDGILDSFESRGIIDDYWRFVCKTMLLYRHYKNGNYEIAFDILNELPACRWKISMMYFMKDKVMKLGDEKLAKLYTDSVNAATDDLVDDKSVSALQSYIGLSE